MSRIEKLKSTPAADRLELKNRELAAKNKVLAAKVVRAEKKTIELEAVFSDFAQLKAVEKVKRTPVKRRPGKKNEAIAVIHFTDWHVAEIVSKSKTNGLNSFNPEICKQRVNGLVGETIALIRLHQKTIKIENIVLILGGDFVTGYLHPELEQTNSMGPIEESYFAIELLTDAISEIYQIVKPKKIRVICHRGNHGRTTKKMQFKNDFETSYETLIYWVIRDRLKSLEKIEFVVDPSSVTYTELIPGYSIRSIHGHQIRYNGGVGGLLVPANRWILKQQQTRQAILTILGHFHQYNKMKGCLVSGSIKGWDEYAQEFGFEFEPPTQSFELFDIQRRSFVSASPIFCE